MPCYYTYKYYTDTIEESQLMYLTGAASRIGAAVGNTTEGFRVNFADGTTAYISRQRDSSKAVISSSNEGSVGDLIQELVVSKLRATLELEGKSVERKDVKGNIELTVSE